MKNYLQKIFFVDHEAAGAFLALTIWILASWFAANLVTTSAFTHIFFHSLAFFVLPLALLLFALLVVYPMILFLRGIVCYISELWKPRSLAAFACGAAMITAAVICFQETFNRIRYKFNLNFTSSSFTPDPAASLDWLYQNFDWLYALLSLCLFVGGYLAIGKSFSIMAKVDYRKLFGRCVCSLWAVALAVYLGTGIAAFCSIARYHRALDEASTFFGRPVTNVALGELFDQGCAPNGDFWKTLKDESAKYALPPLMEGGPHIDNLPSVTELPQTDYETWKGRLQTPEVREWLETRFAKPLPPDAKDFSENANLAATELTELSILRQIVRREAWMTRFALEDHDSAALFASLKHSANAREYLENMPFVLSYLVAVACDTVYASSLAAVIPSDLVGEAWLESLIGEMQTRDTQIAECQPNLVYSELATIKSAVEHFFFRHSNIPQEKAVVRPAAYFWILPKFCDFTYSNLNEYIRLMTVRNCDGFRDTESRLFSTKFVLPKMVIPALGLIGEKAREHQGICREITMLAQAELIKRRTGSYPQQLQDIPADPFNESIPMQYLYGDFEAKAPVWSPEEKNIVTRTQKIHGIKVWFTYQDKKNKQELFIPVP